MPVCGSGALVCSSSLLIRSAQRARCQAETPPIVLSRFPRPALALFELHTVYSDMQLTLQMSRSYPWRKGHPISQSQHLGFVWFQHMNLCYMFREKYKLSANRGNELQAMFKRPFRENVGAGLK